MTTAGPRARMLVGLPIDERRVHAGGVDTLVLEGGAGPSLVLLHGGIECGGAMWAPVMERLAANHRVIVPDVPGLGGSAPLARLDADSFASWFTAILEQTQAHRPTLVAHSLLGSIAARYAARHGDALDRLVIYAAPGIGPYRMPLRLRYVAVRFALRPTARNAERFDRFAVLDLDATRARDRHWFAAFEDYTRERAVVPHVKRTMRHLIRSGTTQIPADVLAAITTPTSLLWGRHDRMCPLPVAEHAAAAFGWPLHTIERAAHAPHIEQPDAFVRTLSAIESHRWVTGEPDRPCHSRRPR
jgi:pimeloyl-ACP methyl ester carboxylesterase